MPGHAVLKLAVDVTHVTTFTDKLNFDYYGRKLFINSLLIARYSFVFRSFMSNSISSSAMVVTEWYERECSACVKSVV